MGPIAVMGPAGDSRVPGRVEAAQGYLYFAAGRMDGGVPGALPGDAPRDGRDLSKKEQATYDAALDCLLLYFRGEMDFGGAPPSAPPDDDDNPRQPEPVVA